MKFKSKSIREEIEEYKALLNFIVELFGCDSDYTLIIGQKIDVLMNEFYGIA